MTVMEAIKARRSIRGYLDRPVEEEKLDRVLEAARLAPSARNKQDWKFVVVKDYDTRQKLVQAAKNQAFVGEAPVVIAACGTDPDYTMACGQPSSTIDVSIAVAHMCLQAVCEGLGTCWLGAYDEGEVRKILGIPDSARVIALVPLGYPKEIPNAKPRNPMNEIVCYDQWS